MSDTLLIHYNIDTPDQATWSLCNEAGELTGKISTGDLSTLSELASSHPCIVLLHSQCLHINQLVLPTQKMQKMLKAVPYAIEEFIADDIEDFHFVVSKNKNTSQTAVVGIKKTVLQQIIDNFNRHNITVEHIIPDALCLAASSTEKQWACLNYQNQSYLQTNALSGLLVPHELLGYTIKNKLEDESLDSPEKLLFFSEQEHSDVFESLLSNDASNETFVDKDIELISVAYNTHPLVVFCGNYKQALPLNLLQNEFKQKRQSSGYWHHWRLAASLAVVWLTLQLSVSGFQSAQLKEQNDATRAEIVKIYKKAFPESKRIVNPKKQMEQKLKELKSGGGNSQGMLPLLSEAFGTLKANKGDITFQSLTFRNNRMDIGLDGKNLQAIENLNNSLNQNKKIKAEITSSSSEKDKVKGNLRIEGRS